MTNHELLEIARQNVVFCTRERDHANTAAALTRSSCRLEYHEAVLAAAEAKELQEVLEESIPYITGTAQKTEDPRHDQR